MRTLLSVRRNPPGNGQRVDGERMWLGLGNIWGLRAFENVTWGRRTFLKCWRSGARLTWSSDVAPVSSCSWRACALQSPILCQLSGKSSGGVCAVEQVESAR